MSKEDDLEYIDILVEAGEYKELLEFLLDVLPDTKIVVDKVNNKVELYISQSKEFDELNGTLDEFKSNVERLKPIHFDVSKMGYITRFRMVDEQNQLNIVDNFIEDLRKVGIKLEKWQKEELHTLNFMRNANTRITRTRG